MDQSTETRPTGSHTPSSQLRNEEHTSGDGVANSQNRKDSTYHTYPSGPHTPSSQLRNEEHTPGDGVVDSQTRTGSSCQPLLKSSESSPTVEAQRRRESRRGNPATKDSRSRQGFLNRIMSLSASIVFNLRRNKHRKGKKSENSMTEGGGEPDAHPAYQPMIEYIEKFKKHLAEIALKPSESTNLVRQETRAKWLTEKVDKLGKESSNEAAWRAGIESEIFLKFDADVDCEGCGKKLWLCRLLVYYNKGNDLSNLEHRRAARKLCSCVPGELLRGRSSMRSSPLFASVFDEIVYQTPWKPKTNRKPDRIYGLRGIENHLEAINNNASLKYKVKGSPFQKAIKHIHFPFLLLEAKSAKSGVDSDAVYKQSEGSIRAMLQLQLDLVARVHAEGGNFPFSTAPVVWFFSFIGASWEIRMCYPSTSILKEISISHGFKWTKSWAGFETFGSQEVWDGKINEEQDAMQLFELIDYIFDWARDVYRHNIVLYLNVLLDPEYILPDTDVASLRNLPSNEVANQMHRKPDLGRSNFAPKQIQGSSFDLDANPVSKINYQKHEPSEPSDKNLATRSRSD